MKRRLGAATGVIVIVTVVMLAVVGGNASARTVTVAEARALVDDAKIQVAGNVVENSFSIDGDVLTFWIYDAEVDPAANERLAVKYDRGVSATFGNDVTAICTGRKDSSGVLNCSELVTKCPSKYEDASGSLSVSELLAYGDKVLDKPVLVSGAIGVGTLVGVDAAVRFALVDPDAGGSIDVRYEGALPDTAIEGSRMVLTGSIGSDGIFTATNAAFEA